MCWFYVLSNATLLMTWVVVRACLCVWGVNRTKLIATSVVICWAKKPMRNSKMKSSRSIRKSETATIFFEKNVSKFEFFYELEQASFHGLKRVDYSVRWTKMAHIWHPTLQSRFMPKKRDLRANEIWLFRELISIDQQMWNFTCLNSKISEKIIRFWAQHSFRI